MYDGVLNIQRGDVAEGLRAAVLQLVAPLATAKHLPMTIQSTNPHLSSLLQGLEAILCDGLLPHLSDIWPFVVEHFAVADIGQSSDECHINSEVRVSQAALVQEVHQLALQQQSKLPPRWHSRAWMLGCLRDGTLLPALSLLQGIRSTYYQSTAFLCSSGGYEFLQAALQALTPLVFHVSPLDLHLFPIKRQFLSKWMGSRTERAAVHHNQTVPVVTTKVVPPLPSAMPSANEPEKVSKSIQTCRQYHVRWVYHSTEIVHLAIHPLQSSPFDVAPAAQDPSPPPSPTASDPLPPPSSPPPPSPSPPSPSPPSPPSPSPPSPPSPPNKSANRSELFESQLAPPASEDLSRSMSSGERAWANFIDQMDAFMGDDNGSEEMGHGQSAEQSPESNVEVLRALAAMEAIAVKLQAACTVKPLSVPLAVLCSRHAPQLTALLPLLSQLPNSPTDLNSTCCQVAQRLRQAFPQKDTITSAEATAWLCQENYSPNCAGAEALLQYLCTLNYVEVIGSPDGQGATTYRVATHDTSHVPSATSWLQDVTFDQDIADALPAQVMLQGRHKGDSAYQTLFCVLRGSHLFCWPSEEDYKSNQEEEEILDLRGALVSCGTTDFSLHISGPQLEVDREFLIEESSVRQEWTHRLQQAAGRAVVIALEVQAWIPMKGWTDWSATDPFLSADHTIHESGYEWDGSWELLRGTEFGADSWQYAVGFGFGFHPDPGTVDCVRQRKWWRTAKPAKPSQSSAHSPSSDGSSAPSL